MKKLMFLALLCGISALVGCEALKSVKDGVEGYVKNPPETVVTAGKMVLDFLLGLLETALKLVLNSVIPVK